MKVLVQSLYNPGRIFSDLSKPASAELSSLLRYPLLLTLLPPVFAYIGGSQFGWRLGAEEPLYFEQGALLTISLAYYLAVLFGMFSTVVISSWMAKTYGARSSFRVHLAFLTVVTLPLACASVIHLYPHVFVNVLVLIPAIIWSMSLLYRGLPVVLDIPPERGMLMSSSLVAWLLVAAVSLLGISAWLWTLGIGANVRV